MSDLIDGRLSGWPVSIMIERDLGGRAFGAQCAAYTDEHDAEPSQQITMACDAITDACDGCTPARALRKAQALGFIPDAQ